MTTDDESESCKRVRSSVIELLIVLSTQRRHSNLTQSIRVCVVVCALCLLTLICVRVHSHRQVSACDHISTLNLCLDNKRLCCFNYFVRSSYVTTRRYHYLPMLSLDLVVINMRYITMVSCVRVFVCVCVCLCVCVCVCVCGSQVDHDRDTDRVNTTADGVGQGDNERMDEYMSASFSHSVYSSLSQATFECVTLTNLVMLPHVTAAGMQNGGQVTTIKWNNETADHI